MLASRRSRERRDVHLVVGSSGAVPLQQRFQVGRCSGHHLSQWPMDAGLARVPLSR
jgi:hypothetical protein